MERHDVCCFVLSAFLPYGTEAQRRVHNVRNGNQTHGFKKTERSVLRAVCYEMVPAEKEEAGKQHHQSTNAGDVECCPNNFVFNGVSLNHPLSQEILD